MLTDFTGADRVYIACSYTDLRRGIDGLAVLVQQQFNLDPFSNTLFLFCGRRRDRIKAVRIWFISFSPQCAYCVALYHEKGRQNKTLTKRFYTERCWLYEDCLARKMGQIISSDASLNPALSPLMKLIRS